MNKASQAEAQHGSSNGLPHAEQSKPAHALDAVLVETGGAVVVAAPSGPAQSCSSATWCGAWTRYARNGLYGSVSVPRPSVTSVSAEGPPLGLSGS